MNNEKSYNGAHYYGAIKDKYSSCTVCCENIDCECFILRTVHPGDVVQEQGPLLGWLHLLMKNILSSSRIRRTDGKLSYA
jgi:hypothetical protein